MLRNSYYDEVFESFAKYFPTLAEHAIRWVPSGRYEITVTLSDGYRCIYNDMLHTMRRPISTNDGSLSKEKWNDYFAMTLRVKLAEYGLTQKDLSSRTGLSHITIHNYLSGKSTPDVYNLRKIAEALDCSISELTEFNENVD